MFHKINFSTLTNIPISANFLQFQTKLPAFFGNYQNNDDLYTMRVSNYDKFPSTPVDGFAVEGWDGILRFLERELKEEKVWAIDLYAGSYEEDFLEAFGKTGRKVLDVRKLMRPEAEIEAMTQRFITDDVLFGFMSNLDIGDYFFKDALESVRNQIDDGGEYVLVGTGAGFVAGDGVPVVYADLARWEIQQRFRRHEIKALGIDRREESPSRQYKRGYFNDWNICDAHKDNLFNSGRIRYWIDHNERRCPRLISDNQMRQGLERTVSRPFRVVPFFDPAPWGGQWMKEVCGLITAGVSTVSLRKTACCSTFRGPHSNCLLKILSSGTRKGCWENMS